VAVIEVGLGGRLDATNVVEPMVSVITSLSMDHMNVLGDTLAKIAFEKAGIIKPGRPVVVSPQIEEARLVVENVAEERGSRLVQVGRDFLFEPVSHDLDGQISVTMGHQSALQSPCWESTRSRMLQPPTRLCRLPGKRAWRSRIRRLCRGLPASFGRGGLRF